MKRLLLLLVLLCSACQSSKPSLTAAPTRASNSDAPTAIGFATRSAIPPTRKPAFPPRETLAPLTREATVSPTATFIPETLTATSTLSPTPSPYEAYTIDSLRSRTYGGGTIELIETMEENDSFTRYLIRYPSDGLNIYGFANVPKGDGPFPVIIMVHGFVRPAEYQTLDYSAAAADGLTPAGYIVIHPNLRNYPPSDNGDNLFRVGMAIDVLNLIELVKSGAGPAELFAKAAPERIGLWGHSMGGDIVLRVLTVSSDIKAAVLYASMSGDELKNSQLLFNIAPDATLETELTVSSAILARISPMYYYNQISAAVQLHHGTADQTVPVAWAQETCTELTTAGVQIDCLYYPEEGHTFRRRVADQFWNAMLGFYQSHLSP